MARKPERSNSEKVTSIILDAGGRVVGRTRLQKLTYLLELSGLGEGFHFEYRHYGPYSEELATACEDAVLAGILREEEKAASWGGSYSIFSVQVEGGQVTQPRLELARLAVSANPIELELAATAAYLAAEGENDPWGETERLKPEKSIGGRIGRAKALYQRLYQFTLRYHSRR